MAERGRTPVLRLLAVGLALSLAVAGCALSHPAPAPPAPPVIQTVGMTAQIREAAPIHTYVLKDGKTFEISTNDTRVVFEGGLGQPFVLGRDSTGPFVAVFSGQEGRPADCHIVPAGGGIGIERGMFVEIEGILWRKAADFRSDVGGPSSGELYSGVGAFCFNERAEVFAAAK